MPTPVKDQGKDIHMLVKYAHKQAQMFESAETLEMYRVRVAKAFLTASRYYAQIAHGFLDADCETPVQDADGIFAQEIKFAESKEG